jgi:hypothetical protein
MRPLVHNAKTASLHHFYDEPPSKQSTTCMHCSLNAVHIQAKDCCKHAGPPSLMQHACMLYRYIIIKSYTEQQLHIVGVHREQRTCMTYYGSCMR